MSSIPNSKPNSSFEHFYTAGDQSNETLLENSLKEEEILENKQELLIDVNVEQIKKTARSRSRTQYGDSEAAFRLNPSGGLDSDAHKTKKIG